MIGVRLKLTRTAAGLSLRDLAAAIDHRVTAQAIGKYERNETVPGSSVLIALADALHTSVDYLLGDPDLVLEDLVFRKNAFTSKRSEAQVEAQVLAHLERYLAIEDILQLPSARWDEPRDAPYPVMHDLIEADRAADGLRHHWGLGHEPIPNLVELLEERGMKVFAFPLGSVGGLAARVGRPRALARSLRRSERRRLGESGNGLQSPTNSAILFWPSHPSSMRNGSLIASLAHS